MHQKSTKYYLLIYVTKFGHELKSNLKEVAKTFVKVFSAPMLLLFTPEHIYGDIVPI
jgi:hypothetical protein